jgi:beta-glucanase (GH16 family)
MEYRGQFPNVTNGAIHGPGYSGGQSLYGSFNRSGSGFNEGFHVFAVEWTPNAITWYVDNQAYMPKSSSDLPSGAPWVFDHPFFIILNVAVGGNYVGPPDGTTEFPQTMLVDWVRVHRARP